MTKSNRVAKICDCVSCPYVAEIGADHGYITKSLFDQNKIEFAVLTDISEKCLQKAIYNLRGKAYQDKKMFLVGDGLKPLTQYFGTLLAKNSTKNVSCKDILAGTMQREYADFEVVIAGMGGKEIIKILANDSANIYTNFVLQPQRNVVELRTFLQENNYEIKTDVVVREDKMFYNVLVVKKTNSKHPLSKSEMLFGKTNLVAKSKDFEDYVSFEMEKTKSILQQKAVEGRKDYLASLQEIKEWINRN